LLLSSHKLGFHATYTAEDFYDLDSEIEMSGLCKVGIFMDKHIFFSNELVRGLQQLSMGILPTSV